MSLALLKRMIGCVLLSGCAVWAAAQDVHLRLQTRMGYTWNEVEKGDVGCEFLSLAIQGTLNEEFSFAAFQHFNRFDRVTKEDPLAATDWLYLKWRRKQVEVSAGKQMIEYGGAEYDAAPIDLYSWGYYWDHISSFAYALNVAYWLGDTKVTAQVAELPLSAEKKDLALSLSWRGKWGWYEPKHSLNLYGQGENRAKLGSLVLGNGFETGAASLYLDFINRWNGRSVRLLKDFSLVACTTIRATDWMDVRLKYNYDYNRELDDMTCPMGVSQSGYLAAMELYPLKDSRKVRAHVAYRYKDRSEVLLGFTWRMGLL